jgi:hypothetical protein
MLYSCQGAAPVQPGQYKRSYRDVEDVQATAIRPAATSRSNRKERTLCSGSCSLTGSGVQDARGPQGDLAAAPPQERGFYFELAQTQHLALLAERSWALYQRTPFERSPAQAAPDLVEAYAQARRLATDFEALLMHCARDLGVDCRVRPGDVKDANRAIVKMGGRRKALRLDLLAGTLICTNLTSISQAAEYAATFFDVVSFRDRCVAPVTPSGYRDLQLTVRLAGGHLAELKVLHEIIAALDRHEHKIFEIQRGLETEHPQEMPFVDDLVSTIRTEASQRMYTQAGQRVLVLDGLLDEIGADDDD